MLELDDTEAGDALKSTEVKHWMIQQLEVQMMAQRWAMHWLLQLDNPPEGTEVGAALDDTATGSEWEGTKAREMVELDNTEAGDAPVGTAVGGALKGTELGATLNDTATGSADVGTWVGNALIGTAAEGALDDPVVEDDTEAGGTLDGIELLVRSTLDVVVRDGALANKCLLLRWYVLHQDVIWVAERTSKPASFIAFITCFGFALIQLTACLL